MNAHSSPSDDSVPLSREEIMSALFANLVIQQTNTALVLLGRVPHPDTKERMFDLEAAQMFIDQLEMIEVKTKGNLSKEEDQLLKQSLMSLRMAFVEAVESPEAKSQGGAGHLETPSAADQGKVQDARPAPAPAAEQEHHKKFSKKY